MFYKERLIIGSMWFITFISICFISKQRYREASFIFLFAQIFSWIFGLLVVEAGWIEYPVRELPKASKTSFTFEFLMLPSMCSFFNLYFPEEKAFYKKISYYITIVGVFTLMEYFTEKYTLVLKYIHWEWYTTFITMTIFIYVVRSVYKWFFHFSKPFSL